MGKLDRSHQIYNVSSEELKKLANIATYLFVNHDV